MASFPVGPREICLPTESLDLSSIETVILQALACGKTAFVEEESAARALDCQMEDPCVTLWAEAFATDHRIHWVRCRDTGSLRFSLAAQEKPDLSLFKQH